jgi:tRNA (guanine10-N2)-dimethyltransferase
MDYKSLFILGRQPAIGRAELESLLGPDHVRPAGEQAVLSDLSTDQINFSRIGGSTRLAKVLTSLPTTSWPEIARHLAQKLPHHLDFLPPGKLKLGISVFGLSVSPRQIMQAGLELKKIARGQGHSVRFVPNTEPALSSAQVLHNQLTGELGWELLIVKDHNQTWLAQTVHVQDINAYARRDQNRPKRDARVGMLPPKLAQIIINLATGNTSQDVAVLDPFCGTGVVLQEALLMGYHTFGTDIEPRMIDYSRENLAWLGQKNDPILEVGDATSHQWSQPFSTIASEAYLGRPLGSWPAPDKLHEIISTVNTITEKFLTNLCSQVKPGLRLCLAVPAWRNPNGRVHHLPILDHMEQIGYNRVKFTSATNDELMYFRPTQIVARELLVLTRK